MTESHCGECGTKSEREDNFRELQLSFPPNSDNQSVQDLLGYFLEAEKLCGDNQYRCDVCNRLTGKFSVFTVLCEFFQLKAI